jgi:quinol-cytochrome oxidoreductase complex cytochrome b subunit
VDGDGDDRGVFIAQKKWKYEDENVLMQWASASLKFNIFRVIFNASNMEGIKMNNIIFDIEQIKVHPMHSYSSINECYTSSLIIIFYLFFAFPFPVQKKND